MARELGWDGKPVPGGFLRWVQDLVSTLREKLGSEHALLVMSEDELRRVRDKLAELKLYYHDETEKLRDKVETLNRALTAEKECHRQTDRNLSSQLKTLRELGDEVILRHISGTRMQVNCAMSALRTALGPQKIKDQL